MNDSLKPHIYQTPSLDKGVDQRRTDMVSLEHLEELDRKELEAARVADGPPLHPILKHTARLDLSWLEVKALSMFLSFEPAKDKVLSDSEAAELEFLCHFIRLGMDLEMIGEMLNSLQWPFNYQPEKLAYCFASRKWEVRGSQRAQNVLDELTAAVISAGTADGMILLNTFDCSVQRDIEDEQLEEWLQALLSRKEVTFDEAKKAIDWLESNGHTLHNREWALLIAQKAGSPSLVIDGGIDPNEFVSWEELSTEFLKEVLLEAVRHYTPYIEMGESFGEEGCGYLSMWLKELAPLVFDDKMERLRWFTRTFSGLNLNWSIEEVVARWLPSLEPETLDMDMDGAFELASMAHQLCSLFPDEGYDEYLGHILQLMVERECF